MKNASLGLHWLEAWQFSLRVMRKSFFKLFIPSMALSFVMGALLGFIGSILFTGHHVGEYLSVKLIVVLILYTIVALPIYAYLYPLLKRYVIFHGLQELNPFPLIEYKVLSLRIRYRFFLLLIKISLKRFLFQSLAFLVLLLPPIINLMFNQKGLDIIILFSIIALWPLATSYYNYFFAELSYLDEKSQELRSGSMPSVSPILPHKKLFWPILSWKAILFIVYIALLFVLSFSWSYIATFCDSQSGVMGNRSLFGEFLSYFAEGLSESLSPLLTMNFLFVSFVPVLLGSSSTYPSYILWIQAVFLLLFGLLTAFFFLVETLSSVYFYHGSKEK